MNADDLCRRADETYYEWLERTEEFWMKRPVTPLKAIFTAVDVIRAHAMGVEL